MGTVQLVSSAQLLASDLLDEYAAECSIPEIGPINPDAQMYAQMEALGIVKLFGVFRDEKLVGFASLLVTRLPHYSQRAATLESLFVSRKQRNCGAGVDLMRAVERYAKEAGCKVILYSAPVGSQLERLLSKRKRSRKTNSVYCIAL